jgi:sugar lactone lactonase YvrE
MGGEVVALNRRTGNILERIGHSRGVDAPDDVAVGPDGSIYWTDIQIGEVGRLSPSGAVTKQKVALGMNPIAFSSDGRLFVAQAFLGDGLYELDPNLVSPPKVVIPDSGTPPFVNQLNGFDFGPDGMLYAPQPFLGRIVKINPDTGSMVTVAEGFGANPPTSVEFDSQGHLFATLRYKDVVRINVPTGSYEVYAHIKDLVADNMTFDAADTMFVSDSTDGAVYRMPAGGTVRTLSRGGLILPGGIAVMKKPSGGASLFVADVWTLAEYGVRSGTLRERLLQTPIGPSIVEPWTVVAHRGNLILTSWMSNAVQVWDVAGDKEVFLTRDFAVPLNALRFRGDLVVAQLGDPSRNIPPSVARLDSTGQITLLATGLAVPAGLASNGGDLWVSDWATGNVWKVASNGTVLKSPRLVASGLSRPEGMAVAQNGSLLVVETGKQRLVTINRNGHVTTLARHLRVGLIGSAGAPPTYAMSSVAVAPNGTIFVSGDLGSVIYRLTRDS